MSEQIKLATLNKIYNLILDDGWFYLYKNNVKILRYKHSLRKWALTEAKDRSEKDNKITSKMIIDTLMDKDYRYTFSIQLMNMLEYMVDQVEQEGET